MIKFDGGRSCLGGIVVLFKGLECYSGICVLFKYFMDSICENLLDVVLGTY